MFVGLIAHLTGLTLQDDIATTARQLQQLGHDILARCPLHHGGRPDAQTPHFVGQTRHVPPQFSWVDQRLVRDHYIDQLSSPACALYLFLVTVADAQGLVTTPIRPCASACP